MATLIFDYPPSVELLQLLARVSLRQSLPKAVRLWVILRSLYGEQTDEVKLPLGEHFSYEDWREQFFTQTKTHHQRDKIPAIHAPDCRCTKTLSEWLFGSSLSLPKQEWCRSFQQLYAIKSDELESFLSFGIIPPKSTAKNTDFSPYMEDLTPQPPSLQGKGENSKPLSLQERGFPYPVKSTAQNSSQPLQKNLPKCRLFAVTGKNLEYHFATLVEMGWLQPCKDGKGKIIPNQFFKASKFPVFALQSPTQQEIESQPFTHPDLAAFNDNFSQSINGVRRFFVHVEYIVHEKLSERVKTLQNQLKTIWEQETVPLVKLTYQSAKRFQEEADYIVYPVCIYYYQRAPYLFAYGQTPQNQSEDRWSQINWYDYRLDRIEGLKALKWVDLKKVQEELDDERWVEVEIPRHFIQKCSGKSLPSVPEIQTKMGEALGFEFYQEKQLLLLRFNPYFHGNYIAGTERTELFKQVDIKRAEQLISHAKLTPENKQYLLSRIKSRPSDIYCQVDYRVNDNNVVMRLRAWGPNVEVLLPWDLRQRMKKDLEDTWNLYQQ